MGRKSKLTPEQWTEAERRHLEGGESLRSLARHFKVDESTLRGRISPHTPQVRDVAQKVVEARDALATLPVNQQYTALNLADKLRSISSSLASAAELGAKTSHRLQALANSEVVKVDDENPLASVDNLRNVGVLTKLANESAHIAINLLAANKGRVQESDDDDAPKGLGHFYGGK